MEAGLSRIDFFLEEQTNKIYLNEINTMPGFTCISMYPMLFEKCNINYTKLLDKLIELSLKKWYNYPSSMKERTIDVEISYAKFWFCYQ